MSLSGEDTLKRIENLGKLPPSISEIVQLPVGKALEPRVLAQVVEHDPALTFEVLKLVNSAFYGVSKDVSNVRQAVVLLGTNTVRNICLALSLGKRTQPVRRLAVFSPQTYWEHAISTGIGAKMMAQEAKLGDELCKTAYLVGLTHDIGKLAFLSLFPDAYADLLGAAERSQPKISLQYLELSSFGVNHGQAGAHLARRWKFADDFAFWIEHHHNPVMEPGDKLGCILAIANYYSVRLGYGRKGSLVDPALFLDHAWFRHVEIESARVDALLGSRLKGEMDAARSFLSGIAQGR